MDNWEYQVEEILMNRNIRLAELHQEVAQDEAVDGCYCKRCMALGEQQ